MVASLWSNNFEELLDIYANEADRSEKTRMENSGLAVVYTRNDLDTMQAHSLKDILRSYLSFRYRESRFGYADPLNMGWDIRPFNSSLLRIYIDGFEVTSALYGSSLIFMAEMNIDFVDHIELYAQNPTLEYVAEPTMLLIRLYTKSSERDLGGRLTLAQANTDYNHQSLYYTGQEGAWQYMGYAGRIRDVKEPVDVSGYDVKRGKESLSTVLTLTNKEHVLMLNSFLYETSPLFDLSADATPNGNDKTRVGQSSLGYSYHGVENLEVKAALERGNTLDRYGDDAPFGMIDLDGNGTPDPISSFLMKLTYAVATAEGKYTARVGEHQISSGLKSRLKRFKYDEVQVNGTPQVLSSFDRQSVYSVFAEDQYRMNDKNVIVAGVQASRMENNGGMSDHDLVMARIGHTYTSDRWSMKTFGLAFDSPMDPYLFINFFAFGPKPDPEKITIFSEEVKYTGEQDAYRAAIFYRELKDAIVFGPDGYLINNDHTVRTNKIIGEYIRRFDHKNRLELAATYKQASVEATPQMDGTEKNLMAKLYNTFGNITLYNEIIHIIDADHENFTDYNLALRYWIPGSYSISLKGENLLNRAVEQHYLRQDASVYPPQMLEPVNASPFERRVYLNLDYFF